MAAFKRKAPLGDRLTALGEAADIARPYLPQDELARLERAVVKRP